MQSALGKQQNVFRKMANESESCVKASYVLSQMIAHKSKPFTDGYFLKECMIKAAEIVCPDKVKVFQQITLSPNTVVSRVTDIADNLRELLQIKAQDFQVYSIAIDESTDVQSVAQLSVFVRGCDSNLCVTEELLELIPMHDTTTGDDIFSKLMEVLDKYNLPLSKLTCLVTDGARAMTGRSQGVLGKLLKTLSETERERKFVHFHCLIHQEVLCAKVMNMEHVLKPVTKTVNFIRAQGLNHRQFSKLLDDLGIDFDLPYFTEVRWLSCSKVLKRFFQIREEIILFMEMKGKDPSFLRDQQWLRDLEFLADITAHLSELNLKQQGKNQLVTTMYDAVRAFQAKLCLWEKQLSTGNLAHFTMSREISSAQSISPHAFKCYASKITSLIHEFNDRFQDFKSCEKDFALFTGPFSYDAGEVCETMQMELIEMQCDSALKDKFNETGVPECYNYLSDRFPNFKKFVSRHLSMFGSTYLCEQLFSLMQSNKTATRSRITDEHLSSVMKVVSAKGVKPDWDGIVARKRWQISGQS